MDNKEKTSLKKKRERERNIMLMGQKYNIVKTSILSQERWLTSIILALWEAEVDGSLELRRILRLA